MTTEQALRDALADEISAAAAMAGPCQEGLMPRCRCFKCRRGRSIAALALPVSEVTDIERLKHTLAFEICQSGLRLSEIVDLKLQIEIQAKSEGGRS